MANDFSIQFSGGTIINITEDSVNYSGCKTCVYGSKYETEVDFYIVDDKKKHSLIRLYGEDMYDYSFTMLDVLKVLLEVKSETTLEDLLFSLSQLGKVKEISCPCRHC